MREGDHAGAEALEIRLVAAGEEVGAVVGDADQIAGDERVALGERGAVAEFGRNGLETAEFGLVDAVAAALGLDFRPIERHDPAQEGLGGVPVEADADARRSRESARSLRAVACAVWREGAAASPGPFKGSCQLFW